MLCLRYTTGDGTGVYAEFSFIELFEISKLNEKEALELIGKHTWHAGKKPELPDLAR